jgi:hypothetical protein
MLQFFIKIQLFFIRFEHLSHLDHFFPNYFEVLPKSHETVFEPSSIAARLT